MRSALEVHPVSATLRQIPRTTFRGCPKEEQLTPQWRFSIIVPVLLPSAVQAPRSLADVYGPDIAVCARPALETAEPAGRNRHTRDVVSARPIAVAADTPVICSAEIGRASCRERV